MPRTLLGAERKRHEHVIVLHARQPQLNDPAAITLKYGGHTFRHSPGGLGTGGKIFTNYLYQFENVEWLEQDLVSLEKDGVGGLLHFRIAAVYQGHRLRMRVAHGADHGQPVASVRHMQV